MSEPRSLAVRVLAAVLLILMLGAVMVTSATWWNGSRAARQSYDRILLGAATDIAESIRLRNGAPFVDLPVSAFQLLAQAPDDRVYYVVRDSRGRTVTGLTDSAEVTAPRTQSVGPVYWDGALNGEAARFIRVSRLFAERDFSGSVEVIVGQTRRARVAMTRQLMGDALWPMALAGLLLIAMSWLVVRSALHPLEALIQDLARRDPRDLTPMEADRLPRELQLMLGAMNRFMGRIDAQVEAMRNLISDTAHQLRTPVAAIRVQAETARDAATPQARDRAVDRLLTRTRSLGALLDQLLSRAMVIHRTDSAPRVSVDLREVALDIIESRDHDLLAPGAEVRLQIGDRPVMVRADAFSLGEAARNLLANALKHGRPPVSIGASHEAGMAVLWVRDSGTGPDETIGQRLGDRFNRSTGTREEGTGLGLSIVASVARAFGGRVAMDREADGFRTALVLPADPTPSDEDSAP